MDCERPTDTLTITPTAAAQPPQIRSLKQPQILQSKLTYREHYTQKPHASYIKSKTLPPCLSTHTPKSAAHPNIHPTPASGPAQSSTNQPISPRHPPPNIPSSPFPPHSTITFLPKPYFINLYSQQPNLHLSHPPHPTPPQFAQHQPNHLLLTPYAFNNTQSYRNLRQNLLG
ncbi:MAG: hypothetical protein Q9184_005128 [Pyrenodesmia sp. 2 TL-2023]